MTSQDPPQPDAKRTFWIGIIALAVLPMAFLAWIVSGHDLEVGQIKIHGGFGTNGQILDLMSVPQGISFSGGDTVGSKLGYELDSKSIELRIGNTQLYLILEQWIEADNYMIPQTSISTQELRKKSHSSSDNKESSTEPDPFGW